MAKKLHLKEQEDKKQQEAMQTAKAGAFNSVSSTSQQMMGLAGMPAGYPNMGGMPAGYGTGMPPPAYGTGMPPNSFGGGMPPPAGYPYP